MKRALLIWAAMACMAVHSVPAQDATVNKIIEIGQTDNQVMDHLDILTNRIGGRVIGSNAYDNAVDWVSSKFKEWGLEVELQEAGTLPVGFNRGPWFGKLLGENGMELHFVTPSYTAGTKGVQRGHVLQEPLTQSEFDRIKGQLKGAWVLINGKNVGWPVDRSAKGDSIRATIIAENMKRPKRLPDHGGILAQQYRQPAAAIERGCPGLVLQTDVRSRCIRLYPVGDSSAQSAL